MGWAALAVVGALVAIVAIWFWVGASDEQVAAYDDDLELFGGYEGEDTVEAIVENAEAYAGRQVSVRGESDGRVGARAFELEGDDPLFDDEVLVLDAGGVRADIDDDDRLLVHGTVRIFRRADIERELGVALEDDLFDDYEGKPVVIAERVESGATAALR